MNPRTPTMSRSTTNPAVSWIEGPSNRDRLAARLRAVGLSSTLGCIIIASVTLIGWILGWKVLAAWHDDGLVLDPDTAVGLILAGFLLWSLRSDTTPKGPWSIYVGAAIVMLIGMMGLVSSMGLPANANWDIGLDRWPFGSRRATFGSTDGRSFNAAISLVLAGVWLLLRRSRATERGMENALALGLLLFAVGGLVGFTYRFGHVAGLAPRTPMSLPAATACLTLAVGMLVLRSDRGLSALVLREGQGGRLARRLLPVALLAPAMLTAILWAGVWMRRYPPEFVAILLSVACGVFFFGLVWWYADTLDQAEAHSRRTSEALRSSEAFYHSLVESLPQSILRKDLDGRFTFGNGKVIQALNLSLDRFLSKTDFDFYPADLAEKYRRDDLRVIESGQTLDTIEAHVEPGGDLRYVQVIKTPLRDHDSRIVGIQCIFWDVTERKIAEEKLQTQNALLTEMARSEKAAHDARKRAQAQMIQSAKLAGLGEMVAGVAHEINNPLSFVNNNVAVLERDLGELRTLLALYTEADRAIAQATPNLAQRITEFRETTETEYTLGNLDGLLGRTREGLRRIQQIVKDLRVFARLDESELAEFNLNDSVQTTVTIIMGHAKHKRVTIELDLHPLPRTIGYAAKINQVVMNLVGNAIDACEEGGKVIVRTVPDEQSHEVQLEVIDNGCGIDAQIRDRIFDPFFTTKPVGVGTGLGLSISYGIVQDHGGSISVESTPGQGTCFNVRLPLDGRVHLKHAARNTEKNGDSENHQPVHS